MKFSSSAVALILAFSGIANAQEETSSTEAQTKLKIEDTRPKNKVDGDIDQEITNAKLRAESGSKSRWSGSFTGSYSGGSLAKPFDKYRANTSQETTPPRVNLAGDVNIRYRANKNNSFTLGTGVSLQQPFHGAKYGDVSTIIVGHNNIGKIGTIQNILGSYVSIPTSNDDITLGKQFGAGISEMIMYDFNGSRLTLGFAIEADYVGYRNNKNAVINYRNSPQERFVAGSQQRDYTIAGYPLIEYALSDMVQLRTVFRPWIFDHNVFADTDTLTKRNWTQSFGVGFAVTRDIYLYPNFQWDVEQWRGAGYNFFAKSVRDNTNLALSATINVF